MDYDDFRSEIESTFSSLDFEHDGFIRITGANWTKDSVVLEITIRTGEEEAHQVWQAEISGVREERFSSEWDFEEIELLSDGPLLWSWNEPEGELYFAEKTENPDSLLGQLLNTHYTIAGDWLDFLKFFNQEYPLRELCSFKHALLARGPIRLLKAYAEVLEVAGMKPKIIGERGPRIWTGQQWIPQEIPCKVLLLGNAYVVGESFNFTRT